MEDWTNPTGDVLGAFQAAMLHDTVGPALLATLGPDLFQTTLDLNVQFIRSVRPGRLLGRDRVVGRKGDLAFLEAGLLDEGRQTVAKALAAALVIPLAESPTAA